MTDAPPSDSSADDEPERPAAPVYPPPYGQRTSDDELAAALAAQTAMYTGPITLPVVNEDAAFRPDPAELHQDVPPPTDEVADEDAPAKLPPMPVPPPPEEPEYVADDVVAADPEQLAFASDEADGLSVPEEDAAPEPWGDDPLSRSVQEEAETGSTLDAILLLEAELRKRQGLPSAPPVAPPADAGAALAGAPLAAAAFVAPPPVVGTGIPGWTPAPDPEREGESDAVADEPWLAAPPPSFAPPELVEPPPPTVEPLDPSTLTPDPLVEASPEPVDVSLLPPPAGPPVVATEEAPAPPAADDADAAALLGAAAVVGAASAPVDASVEPVLATEQPVPAPPAAASESEPELAADVEPAPVAEPDAFAVETASLEPTPAEQRAGHAARMYWLWFAANASVIVFAIGALLITQGASLRQALVAVVAGVGLSALPLGLGTLAGKWSGQPTMVVSRASFGTVGNIVPAILAVVGRVLWGGVMLWLLAATTSTLLVGEGSAVVGIIVLVVGALLAALVAGFGYGMLHRIQRILGILSTILVVATIVLTMGHIDIGAALQIDDGSWVLAIGGSVLVFSVVGLAWAQSGSDLARYQRSGGSGAANMLWATFGTIVPTLAILTWGALLASSDPSIADGLVETPIATLRDLVPAWFVYPLLGATAFGLMSAAIVASYSGGLALGAVGLRSPRAVSAAISAALAAVCGAGLLLLDGDIGVLADIVTTIAVPVAAWTGIFAGEMMIRLRRFHAPSLLVSGGVYPRVRTVNLVGLIVISVLAFGFTSSELPGLDWQGFLFGVLGAGAGDPLRESDLGVLLALGLGLVLTVTTAIPAIRRQERDEAPVQPPAGMPAVDAS